MASSNPYTCSEYREEMLLLSLERRLNTEDLTEEEREGLKRQIRDLEASMGMD